LYKPNVDCGRRWWRMSTRRWTINDRFKVVP
jgi:hypothetical protein